MEEGFGLGDAFAPGPKDSPEALLISAFVENGEFVPERYRITTTDLACWGRLWNFCLAYQQRTGRAPPPSLLATRYPEFELTPDLDAGFAAAELRNAAASRALRRTMGSALAALNADEPDVSRAYACFDDLVRPSGVRRDPVDVFDHTNLEDDLVSRWNVPWPSLARALSPDGGKSLGGLVSSWLVYVAARPGVGKSQTCVTLAGYLAEQGAKVRYVSLEMRAKVLSVRMLRYLARTDAAARAALAGDYAERKAVLDTLRGNLSGEVAVVDPSHGAPTLDMVLDYADGVDVLVLDHIDLVRVPNQGSRPMEDVARIHAISKALREETLRRNFMVIAAVQANRNAVTKSVRPPRLHELYNSDAPGQDGDLVLTLSDPSPSLRWFSAEKVREGVPISWKTDYDPLTGRMGEISESEAVRLANRDEARGARVRTD